MTDQAKRPKPKPPVPDPRQAMLLAREAIARAQRSARAELRRKL